MPQIQLIDVVDSTARNVAFPPENLIRRSMNGKWLCKKGEVSHMISATFKLPKPTIIGRIDIGNFNSASVTVLVSRNGSKDFKEILSSRILRTEAECRNLKNGTGVLMHTCTDLREDTRHESWDLIKVICHQPYRRPEDESFGLSFFSIFDAPNQLPGNKRMVKLKEAAFRTSSPAWKDINSATNLTRAQKMMLASKPSSTGPEVQSDDDLFKATVISLIESNANVINTKSPSDAKSELIHKSQTVMGRKLSFPESKLFSQIFRNYSTTNREKPQSGILTPRTSNHQLFSSSGCKKMEDTKLSLFQPQNESFNSFNTQTVYWAEVVHNHGMKDGPVSYMGRSGKENTPYLLEKNGLTNGDALEDSCPPVLNSEKKMCLDQVKHDKFSPRDTWKNRNDIEKCDSRDCSPDTWLKRKSDPSGQPTSKKRPRENTDDNFTESMSVNRVTPPGGWLLNGSGFHKKKLSPSDTKMQDSMKFPFRVSPPPPPDRPASPISLVDDLDQPSTSSRETVAERNIRLEMERRLAERSPPERVVQRTSAGKVKGPFCTKGMNTNDSPLRRLSICDENEEIGSPQARRKLSFVRQNGQDGDQPLVECPVCKCFFESCDINKHLDECVPSPIKKPDDGENDEEMACPICGLWQPKDTVAAHADECAQKRYGA